MTGALVHRVLAHAADRQGPAVVAGDRTLTWPELGAAVRNLASRLVAAGVRADDLVAVPGDRDVDYVVSVLAVLAAGGAFVPLDPAAPEAHARRLAARAGIRYGVGTRTRLPFLDVVVAPDGEPADDAVAEPGRLAYGLFTSGTTGEPHLVGVEQASVLGLLAGFDEVAPPRSTVVSAAVCPFAFDVSIWELFSALGDGGTVVVLDEQQVRDPARLLRAWRQHRVTSAYCPPALLDAVADELDDSPRDWSLQRLLTGVEPISQRTLARFTDHDPALVVVNGYGPTEATVCCTLYRLRDTDRDDRRTPIGTAIPGYQVRLVDPDRTDDLAEVAAGAVGELVVTGVGLARGYLDDPDLTARRFVSCGGRRWYRTGDLARWLPSGDLEFAGRRDHQVKVRGIRVELGDVEAAMLRCPGLRVAVPVAVPGLSGRRLVGFAVPDPASAVTEAQVTAWLGEHLPAHLVPSRVVLLDGLPVTANGKADREALVALARTRSLGTGHVAAPEGRASTLAALWAQALGVDQVGLYDGFAELGGDSVTAIHLARRICREFGIGGHPGALLTCATVAEQLTALDTLLDALLDTPPRPAPAPAGTEPAQVSVGQEGLWFRQAADPDDLSFVLPVAIRVRGPLTAHEVAAAVDRLVAAHAAFGTRIEATDQGLRQDTAPVEPTEVLAPVTDAELTALLVTRYRAAAAAIAALRGPLVRAEVVPLVGGEHVVLLAAHHLVVDGGSVPTLVDGLSAALRGQAPPPSPSSAAFAREQRHLLTGTAGDAARAHWAAVLAELGETVDLAPAGARDVPRRGRGAVLRRGVDAAEPIPFTAVLAAVANAALRLGGGDDVVVATPVAVDRTRAEVADAVGYYVNLVPVRCRTSAGTTRADLHDQVATALDGARVHGWYPFEEQLSLLDGARGAVAQRLTRLIAVQDVPTGLPLRAGDLELTEEFVDGGVAKYELALFARSAPDGHLELNWEYDTDRYDSATVARVAATVEDLLRDPDLTQPVESSPKPAADLPPAPELPQVEAWARQAPRAEGTVRLRAALPPDLTRQAADRGLELADVLLAAVAETVGRWARSPRFTLGQRVATAVVPLVVDLGELLPFVDRARRIGNGLAADRAQDVVERTGTTPLPVAVDLTGGPDPVADLLSCVLRQGELVWDVHADVLPDGLPADLVAACTSLLDRLAAGAGWDEPVTDLLPPAQAACRAEVNATGGPLPDSLLHEPFLVQAAATPDAVAVEAPGRNLTYRELLGRSAVVAGRLDGVRPGEPVALCMEKGWEQVVGVMGVLLAGAAYVPVDATQPVARRDAVLADAGVRYVLTQSWLAQAGDLPAGLAVTVVDALPDALPGEDRPVPPSTAGPDDLAYVIYTSGSTGTPKGVMTSHRGALNTVHDVNRRYGVGADDRVAGIAALGFDLSVYDVFGTFAVGGTLVLPEHRRRADPAHWVELLERGVTVWNTVPGQLQMLCDWLRYQPAAGATRLRLALLSGDWIPVTLPDEARALFPGLRVIGMGGATEGAIWSIAHPIDVVDTARPSIPYGTPLTNQWFTVVDDALRPRPDWVSGELCIGGAGVALGYLGDPARTAARFVTDLTGRRVYRTGDLGRYLPDGTLEFLGREDTQVKVRGYRVELAEVETAVQTLPDVAAAAVVVDRSGTGGPRLVAFVQPARGDVLTSADLARGTGNRLPEYMVPSAWHVLDALPRTGNGKVDRSALTTMARAKPTGTDTGAEQPLQGRAATVAKLWSDVLGVSGVGLRGNFFDLGGDSRSVAMLVARLNDAFGTRMRIVDFMTAATVTDVCAWLDDALLVPAGPAAPSTPQDQHADLRERVARRAAARTRRGR